MFKKHGLKIVIGIGLLLLVLAVVYSRIAAGDANEGVVVQAHTKGGDAPKAVLVKYSDFQCPACQRFYPVLADLSDQYGDDLQIEYKHFPLSSIHPYAVSAAKAAEAAGQQGAFWEMHDLIFEQQSVWSNSGNPNAYFAAFAEQLGLDLKLYRQHTRASLLQNKIEADFAEARELGFTGTPSFTLNGSPLQFETFEEFAALIDAAVTGTTASTTIPAVAEPEVTFGI